MATLDTLKNCGIVPVVVLDNVKDAVPTAQAMLRGGVNVMEITLRTAAGLDSIKEVAQSCPEICVGGGTVLTLPQCRAAVAAGAKFIVSPGFDRPLVEWCVENRVDVTPGCVTPTEITEALSLGINVVKFFPANVYGGLSAMKALAAPFGKVKFIPTGGVSEKNLAEYMGVPYIYAVGGSWLCAKEDISAGNFEKITALCREARKIALGFEFAHLGINCVDASASMDVCKRFDDAFGFGIKEGNSSNFASSGIEVMKEQYLGANGHIAIRTADIGRAVACLEEKGYQVDPDTAKYKGNAMIAIYLKQEFGGFAVHLLQK
ncbi:MAG TPA: bifunctional 4-hydroxy-2-oxoglutarate aldolase/2-dehydro-3-deoxy-phosphogluconate aldolase [Feifaniaceae bacterium]|nr:bifunctional 4-hydroxy-2-oxoglutarate aldolase/2-dehydro-3-deoxy-phosphogluconate aldolase [Feifaniaceae bacterium]